MFEMYSKFLTHEHNILISYYLDMFWDVQEPPDSTVRNSLLSFWLLILGVPEFGCYEQMSPKGLHNQDAVF